MSQDVKKGPSAALIIESSQNYFNQVVSYTYHQRSFQWAKFEAKRFSDAKRVSYLNVPSSHPPPLPPKYKQTNLQILYHSSTKKIAHGLFQIFNKLRSIVSQCKVYYTLVPKDEDIQREYTE